jgi:hypothetical protein
VAKLAPLSSSLDMPPAASAVTRFELLMPKPEHGPATPVISLSYQDDTSHPSGSTVFSGRYRPVLHSEAVIPTPPSKPLLSALGIAAEEPCNFLQDRKDPKAPHTVVDALRSAILGGGLTDGPNSHSGTPIGLPSLVVRQVLVTKPFGALSLIPTFLNSRDYPPIPGGIAYNCVHAETSRRKPPNPESGGDDYA